MTQRTPAQTAIDLSVVLFAFGQISRTTHMPNGDLESDSHHSFVLALMGYELARQYAPELDAAKVMTYGLVHDLAEIITGDVDTLLATEDELRLKREREEQAMDELRPILASGPYIYEALEQYEQMTDEEAKFIYWLDKAMTLLTHFFDDGKSLRTRGATNQQYVENWYAKLTQKLTDRAPEPNTTAAKVLEDLYLKVHDELLPPA